MDRFAPGPEPGKIRVGVTHKIDFPRGPALPGHARSQASQDSRDQKYVSVRTEPEH